MVVLEQHDCIRRLRELLGHCCGKALVDGHVAVQPRPQQVGVPAAEQRLEAVLHEPQGRVRDLVVETPVRRRVVRDEPEPERGAGRALLERPGCRDGALLLAHGAGDPRDVMPGHEGAQRRHEPPGTLVPNAVACGVSRVPDRAAVGDDDQLPPRARLPRD